MPNFHESETVSNPFDIKAGQLVKGRFKITGTLGAGGFGAVYLALDTALGNRQTVIKFLHREMLTNDAARMKFEDEKMALVRLSERRHPGIGDIYDSGQLPDGTPFMAMEFIPGKSLRNRLLECRQAGTALSNGECANILEQLGDALSIAHDLGIIHRDIKPDNLMLVQQNDGSERVVVIDFGIARLMDGTQTDPTRPATGMMGTIPYAAPEQFMARQILTPACDIYAMAALAYEMLTGRYPFPDCALDQFFPQRRQGLRDRPSLFRPGLSPRVDGLIASALAFDPDTRHRRARDFGKELATELRANLPGQASPGAFAETMPVVVRGTDPVRQAQPLPPTVPVGDLKSESDARVERLKEELSLSSGKSQGRSTAVIGIVLALLVLVPAGGFGLWKLLSSKPEAPDTPKIPPAAVRKVTFAVEVQKMRDGKAFGDTYFGNGREVFETGYKFRLELASDTPGDLYVFADGRDGAGKPELDILFPTPKQNGGVPSVTASQKVQTGWNVFQGSTGNEVLYVVWTKSGAPALAAAKKAGFENGGVVPVGTVEKDLREFLERKPEESPKVEFTEDEKRPFTTITGKGDTVVYRVELKHR